MQYIFTFQDILAQFFLDNIDYINIAEESCLNQTLLKDFYIRKIKKQIRKHKKKKIESRITVTCDTSYTEKGHSKFDDLRLLSIFFTDSWDFFIKNMVNNVFSDFNIILYTTDLLETYKLLNIAINYIDSKKAKKVLVLVDKPLVNTIVSSVFSLEDLKDSYSMNDERFENLFDIYGGREDNKELLLISTSIVSKFLLENLYIKYGFQYPMIITKILKPIPKKLLEIIKSYKTIYFIPPMKKLFADSDIGNGKLYLFDVDVFDKYNRKFDIPMPGDLYKFLLEIKEALLWPSTYLF